MTDFATGSVYVLGFVVALLALVTVGVGLFAWLRQRVLWPWELRCEANGYRRAQQKLCADSWWFSEDEPTRQLLLALAQDGHDVGRIRDEWRRARQEPPK